MTALAGSRNTKQLGVVKVVLDDLDVPLAATKIVYQGAIVVRNSSGYGQPATAALALTCIGVAYLNPNTDSVNTTGVAAGASRIRVRQGCHKVANSGSTDTIAQADVGHPCFLVDDQTVAKTNGAGTRSFAGIVMDVDSSGVTVFMSEQLSQAFVFGADFGQEPISVSVPGVLTLARFQLLVVDGTDAYTIGDGTYVGQKVTVTVLSGANTPVATITPTTARGFASVTALGAIGDTVTFMWTATGWIIISNAGVTVA